MVGAFWADRRGGGEQVYTLLPEADVDMATAPHFRGPGLSHEGDTFAVLGRNLFYTLLENNVHVGHGTGLGVMKIELMLTAPPFTFAGFHRNTRGAHLIAQ